MTIEQAHVIAVAAEERRKELVHAIRFYDERGWDDLASEYRVRLNEIDGLLKKVPAVAPGELMEVWGK